MKLAALLLLALGCAHSAPKADPAPTGPSRADLARVAVTVAPQTVVNDPVLQDRAAALRTALAKALADEGFPLREGAGALVVTTSIDYLPWTSVSAASLYLTVGLKSEGVSVDQVEVQKINEAFPRGGPTRRPRPRAGPLPRHLPAAQGFPPSVEAGLKTKSHREGGKIARRFAKKTFGLETEGSRPLGGGRAPTRPTKSFARLRGSLRLRSVPLPRAVTWRRRRGGWRSSTPRGRPR